MAKSQQEEFPDVEKPAEKKREPVRSRYAGTGAVKRRINVPMMRLNPGDAVAFRFDGTTRQQNIGKGKEPATLYRGENLDTGEVCDLIASTVLLSTLQREYPDGVAGVALLIEASQREGKAYRDIFVSELEV